MSARFSPDGLYYWDGERWHSTLSPDGRFRWNGAQWIPTGQSTGPPDRQPTPAQRAPTSWTRPLQGAVAVWYAISGIYALALPFWVGGTMAQIMNQSMRRSTQRYPNTTPPPEFVGAMTSFMTGALWVGALIGFALALVAIIGALHRWTWLYYAVMVLLGLGILGVPINLINIARGPSAFGYGAVLPAWVTWESLVHGIAGGALAVVMLYALVKRGPWGMTRRLPAG